MWLKNCKMVNSKKQCACKTLVQHEMNKIINFHLQLALETVQFTGEQVCCFEAS